MISQGDVYLVKLDPVIGSEIAKTRPCLIVSNNAANKTSYRVSVVPITSNVSRVFPFEVLITDNEEAGLLHPSKTLCDQIRSIDKKRLVQHLGDINEITLLEVKAALRLHLDI